MLDYTLVFGSANLFFGVTSIILCVLQRPQTTEITLPVDAVQINILQLAQRTGVNPT